MLFKKISILFLIFFIACGAGEGDVEVTENISSNSDEPTTTTEQQKENDDSTTTIKEANEESEDYSSENVISIGEIVTDTSFRDYQKYVDVAGLRIFALPEVSDEYMYEVAYVWDLKQALNKITRKMPKVKQGVARGDVNAMQALNFFYAGSRQLWMLDDNDITQDELVIWQAELDAKASEYNLTLDANQYDESILSSIN